MVRDANNLTTQYAPSFPLYSALVVIQLKDSMRTILQPAALGAGCGYHPIGYPIWMPCKLFSFARQTSVEMTIQLCSYSARERFSGGLVQLVDRQQPTLPTFCCAKKGHHIVTSHFWKAFDRSLLSSWACSEKLKYSTADV